ncbi:anomalous homeobox protein [Sminthopsis crassicaudata]|uniref:anomalous homeobox protein n=1 Tax=Sminthopsis crassicaudata TaxID=9301 RepID=UPI003D690F5E
MSVRLRSGSVTDGRGSRTRLELVENRCIPEAVTGPGSPGLAGGALPSRCPKTTPWGQGPSAASAAPANAASESPSTAVSRGPSPTDGLSLVALPHRRAVPSGPPPTDRLSLVALPPTDRLSLVALPPLTDSSMENPEGPQAGISPVMGESPPKPSTATCTGPPSSIFSFLSPPFHSLLLGAKLNQFLAVLEEHRASPAPPPELVHLAARLCQELATVPLLLLEPLAEGVLGSPHWQYFLSNIEMVRMCVLVLACQGQYPSACRLLEHCREAGDSEQLIHLWHEIHYRKAMEKYRVGALTPVQKFRCRKRNPPPPSLCPEGMKSRNFSKDVRHKLLGFASRVTMNPNREQRGRLALETGLQVHQIYNWFANYRRRQRSSVQRQERLQVPPRDEEPAANLAAQPWPEPGPCNLQPEAGFQGDVPLGPPNRPLGPCELAWEPPILGLRCPQEEGLAKMLDARYGRSSEMQVQKPGPDPRTLMLTAGAGFPMEGPRAAMCPPACGGRPGPLLPTLAPWPENFVLGPCGPLPGQVHERIYSRELELLPPPLPGAPQEPPPMGPFSAFWDPRASGYQAPPDRSPPRAGMGPHPEVAAGSFMLREEQLGALECVLPQSSSEMVLEKPSSPPQISILDEPQALEYRQDSLVPAENPSRTLSELNVAEEVATTSVPGDSLNEQTSSDTFWAALLLFEFSGGNRV